MRARFLEEENAKLREEARVANAEKANLQTTIDDLNNKIRRIITTNNSPSEAVTIRPMT